MCNRRHRLSLGAVSRTDATDAPVPTVLVWALVPADAPPEVLEQVERVMQIAYAAALSERGTPEGRR